MPAIDSEVSDFLFQAVQDIREGLPIVEAIAELALPEDKPEIELIDLGLTKLFELLARLQSAPKVDLEPAKEQLRAQTVAAWRARV